MNSTQKYIILAIAGLLLLSLPQASAQDTFPLKFSELQHHFGKMKQGERKSHTFYFKNIGMDTVLLAPPKASCGCTAALLSSNTIAPGDSGSLAVTFSAVPGVTGKSAKTVGIFRIVDELKTVDHIADLGIGAEIFGEVYITPTFVRYETEIGKDHTVEVQLESNTDRRIEIKNVGVALMEYADTTAAGTYDLDKVVASPVTEYKLELGKEALEPGETTKILLTIPSREKGQINGSIRISLPNSEVTVGISGVIVRNRQ